MPPAPISGAWEPPRAANRTRENPGQIGRSRHFAAPSWQPGQGRSRPTWAGSASAREVFAMLSAGKLGRGQERYYLDKVAEGAEDHYTGEGEAEGAGSAMLPRRWACRARLPRSS